MQSLGKYIFVIVALLLFLQCDENETYPNEPVNIPDKAFLSALIDLGVDTNGDSIISIGEAEEIGSLSLGKYKEISDLTGIEAFTNLDSLNCQHLYSLSYLDLTKNESLTFLDCHTCSLTSLNVSRRNSRLTFLFCGDCGSTSDPSCHDYNNLTVLDISKCIKLEYLDCRGNCLSTLDLSNNTKLEEIVLQDMPSMNKVYVWTLPFPPEGANLHMEGSPNIEFSTK